MSDLPPGWESVALGKLAIIKYGKGLSAKQREGSGIIPVVSSAGVAGKHTEALVHDPAIVIGRKGNAGAVWSMPGPCWPIDTTYFLEVPPEVDQAFLAHHLAYLNLGQLDSSTAIPSLRREDLEASTVALPPRAEQKRIVAAIEEHLSHLDAAEAAVESARHRVQRLERTILARAQAEGGKVDLGGLLLDIEAGKSFKTPGRRATSDEWGVIKVSAMTWGDFDEDENKAVPTDHIVDPRYQIRSGDLLLSRANTSEYVGATVLVGACRPRLLLSDKSMRLIPHEGVDRRWLRYALSAHQVRSQMSLLATGTSDSMRNISQEKVRGLRIRVPEFHRQRVIANEIHMALDRRARLKAELAVASSRAASLRSAILAAALSGQLVPQDPDDDPASVLLDRVRAEHAAATPTKHRWKAKAP